MAFTEIETLADLKAYLDKLTPQQLAQKVQIAKPTPMPMVELQVGLAMGTVAEMGFWGARSITDNKYHADDVVMLTDSNPFGEDGAIAYTMDTSGSNAKAARSLMRKENPIYGKDGPTPKLDQIAPEYHLAYKIDKLDEQKDQLIKDAEYEAAAKIRDEITELRKQLSEEEQRKGELHETDAFGSILKNRMKDD